MPTIGKHTGTGALLRHDTSGALLFDPDSGALLCDGDVYFNQDWVPDDSSGWVHCEPVWSRRFYKSKSNFHGRIKRTWTETDPDTGQSQTMYSYYTNGEMQSELNGWYPASDPTTYDTRSPEGYQFVSSGNTTMSAEVRIGAILVRLPQNSQSGPTPTRITVDAVRVGMQVSGTGLFEARWKLFGESKEVGLYGGREFYSASVRNRSTTNRTGRIGMSRTYVPDAAPYLYIELRPKRLTYTTEAGGKSGSLSVRDLGYGRDVSAHCSFTFQ